MEVEVEVEAARVQYECLYNCNSSFDADYGAMKVEDKLDMEAFVRVTVTPMPIKRGQMVFLRKCPDCHSKYAF